MKISFWSADAPGHQGRPELFIKPTAGLSATSQLRWRARCSCGWVGPTEYLSNTSHPICPPTTSSVTRAEWEVHRAEVDAPTPARKAARPLPEARQFPLLQRTISREDAAIERTEPVSSAHRDLRGSHDHETQRS